VWGASGRGMVEHLDEIDLDHGMGAMARGIGCITSAAVARGGSLLCALTAVVVGRVQRSAVELSRAR
jgi:hypothetical protein